MEENNKNNKNKVTPPKEFAENVYIIQDLIKQVPELYKAAQKDWAAGQKKAQQLLYGSGYYAYHDIPYPEKQDQDLHIWSAEPYSLDLGSKE